MMCDSSNNGSNSVEPVSITTGSTPTKCTICHKYYKNMAAHLKDHKRERKCDCDYCHRKFVWKYKLIPHMDVHVAGQRFKCSYCPRGFSFISTLEYHLRSHTNQNVHLYQCEFCGKEFKYPHTLTTHLRTHTKEKPYKCTMCEKSYSQFVSLQHHIMIHNGQKPYHCDICGKGFSDLTGEKLHKRTHTNESPFICHLCGKATKTIGNLKSHYSYVHKIKDITGPTIQKNSKVFAKYTAEELKTIGLLEILSREAMANVLKQESRVEDNLVFSRGPKPNSNTKRNLNNSLGEPTSLSTNSVLNNETSPTHKSQWESLVDSKIIRKHERRTALSNEQKKVNHSKNNQAIGSVFIKSESGEIEGFDDSSVPSQPYNDPVSSAPADDYTEMIVDVKPVIYYDEENALSSNDVNADNLKDRNLFKPEPSCVNNDCDSQQTSSRTEETTETAEEKPVKSKPTRNRQKREGELYICDICNKFYKKKDHLKGHIITHSEKNFICEQAIRVSCNDKQGCHYAAINSTILRIFEGMYGSDIQMIVHLLAICAYFAQKRITVSKFTFGRISTRKSSNACTAKSASVAALIAIATKGLIQAFADGSVYKQHLSIHSIERPYKCHICGKSTALSGPLKSHYKRCHKIEIKNAKELRMLCMGGKVDEDN